MNRLINATIHYTYRIISILFKLFVLGFFTAVALVAIAHAVPGTVSAMPAYGEFVKILEEMGNCFFLELIK